jgi:hypothetical protein
MIYVYTPHPTPSPVNLERAGATAVVPETLEPSLQLAAAVLREMEFNGDEVGSGRRGQGFLVAGAERREPPHTAPDVNPPL